MSITNADGKRLSNVAFIFYPVFCSPSGIAKHFRLCMQFADSVGKLKTVLLVRQEHFLFKFSCSSFFREILNCQDLFHITLLSPFFQL
jgi:hypothetical protein